MIQLPPFYFVSLAYYTQISPIVVLNSTKNHPLQLKIMLMLFQACQQIL